MQTTHGRMNEQREKKEKVHGHANTKHREKARGTNPREMQANNSCLIFLFFIFYFQEEDKWHTSTRKMQGEKSTMKN